MIRGRFIGQMSIRLRQAKGERNRLPAGRMRKGINTVLNQYTDLGVRTSVMI
jgi:hypothetical protein